MPSPPQESPGSCSPSASLGSSPSPGPTACGDLQVAFVPATQGVKQPDPPIDVTLLITPAAGGPVIRQEIADPSGGFNLMLDPGTYWLRSLEVLAASMSSGIFRLPTDRLRSASRQPGAPTSDGPSSPTSACRQARLR